MQTKKSGRGRFGKFKLVRGVYKITNIFTGNCYVGKSENIELRLCRHWVRINDGYRENPKWAADIRTYGCNSFEYEILEEFDDKDELKLVVAERKWYVKIRPQYNKIPPVIPWSEWKNIKE